MPSRTQCTLSCGQGTQSVTLSCCHCWHILLFNTPPPPRVFSYVGRVPSYWPWAVIVQCCHIEFICTFPLPHPVHPAMWAGYPVSDPKLSFLSCSINTPPPPMLMWVWYPVIDPSLLLLSYTVVYFSIFPPPPSAPSHVGGGTQSVTLSCHQVSVTGREVELDPTLCSYPPPANIQFCNEVECPTQWITQVLSSEVRKMLCSFLLLRTIYRQTRNCYK